MLAGLCHSARCFQFTRTGEADNDHSRWVRPAGFLRAVGQKGCARYCERRKCWGEKRLREWDVLPIFEFAFEVELLIILEE